MPYYFAEVTDTFGGEPNYGWVRRYKVKANTLTGAIRKVPGSWRKTIEIGDFRSYDSGGTRCFVECWDEDQHGNYTVEEI